MHVDLEWFRRQRLLYAISAVAVLAFGVLCVVLYHIVDDAVRTDLSGQTTAAASTAAVAVANAIGGDTRLAEAVVGEVGSADLVQRTATRATTYAIAYANINIQRANPQITAFYYFDRSGTYVTGQVVNPTHQPLHLFSVSCDTTNTYCIDGNPPTDGPFGSRDGRLRLAAQLASSNLYGVVFAYGPTFGPFGNMYVVQAISAPGSLSPVGALVEQVDAASIFAPYVQGQTVGNLFLNGTIVISRAIADFHQHGQLPVTTVGGALDRSITGGLQQKPIGNIPPGANPQFLLNGTKVVASQTNVGTGNLRVVSYTTANSLSASSTRLILATAPFVVLLILCVIGPVYYQGWQAQRKERENAQRLQARSDLLFKEIIGVARALDAARGETATAGSMENQSEVHRLSESLTSLLSSYSETARSVTGVSSAVREVAARMERDLHDALTEAMVYRMTVGTVVSEAQELAAGMSAVREAAAAATRLAADTAALGPEQHAAGGLEGVVGAIKAATIDLTREIEHVKERALRLDDLALSVKTIARDLHAQAAYATREAAQSRAALGTASLTNLERLARQAQDLLVQTEDTARGVSVSMAEMSRRLERLWDQVRDGGEEAHAAEASFAEMCSAQADLHRSIEGIAASAGAQVQTAQKTVHSLVEIPQHVEALIAGLRKPKDELTDLQMLVAGLRESAADLHMEAELLSPRPE